MYYHNALSDDGLKTNCDVQAMKYNIPKPWVGCLMENKRRWKEQALKGMYCEQFLSSYFLLSLFLLICRYIKISFFGFHLAKTHKVTLFSVWPIPTLPKAHHIQVFPKGFCLKKSSKIISCKKFIPSIKTCFLDDNKSEQSATYQTLLEFKTLIRVAVKIICTYRYLKSRFYEIGTLNFVRKKYFISFLFEAPTSSHHVVWTSSLRSLKLSNVKRGK